MKKRETERGFAALIAVLFFLAGSSALVAGIASPVIQEIRTMRGLEHSKGSFAFSEGAAEEVAYRLKNGLTVDASEELSEGMFYATTTISTGADETTVDAVGDVENKIRKTSITLVEGQGVAFAYGVQVGIGGIQLDNNSSILGNVYSNGPVMGTGLNDIFGDVVSAGSSGLVDDVHATGTIYAHSITDSIADNDAYYDTVFTGSVAGGSTHSGSSDQPLIPLPITDVIIDEWQDEAVAGGVETTCPYEITDDVTIGPLKIECDVAVTGSPTITLEGVVWIEGNLDMQTSGATVELPSGIGNKSIPIIIDDPSDRLTGSKAIIKNTSFSGVPGQDRSYVVVISQNESAENGGSEVAITLKSAVEADLLAYAGHGEVLIQTNTDLREITAYLVTLQNSAQVIYETGIGSLIFETGPTGGFDILGWEEVE